ncbi:hypothetical protein D3C74_313870 [compost metagenome]
MKDRQFDPQKQPGQRCAEACVDSLPETQVRHGPVAVKVDVIRVAELGRVTRSRGIREEDRFSRLQLCSAKSDIPGNQPFHARNRGLVPEDLLKRLSPRIIVPLRTCIAFRVGQEMRQSHTDQV